MDEMRKKEHTRPNAKYNLTARKTNDEEVTFYYSRERRLAKAPPVVRSLYEEGPRKKPNLFRTLTATKPLAFNFWTIVVLSALIIIMSTIGVLGDGHLFAGNIISAEAVLAEGQTYLVLFKTHSAKKTLFGRKKVPYSGIVEVAAAPVLPKGKTAEGAPAFFQSVYFSPAGKEEFRFSLPFTAEKILLSIQGEKQRLNFTVVTSNSQKNE